MIMLIPAMHTHQMQMCDDDGSGGKSKKNSLTY